MTDFNQISQQDFFKVLNNSGKAFFVGGCVRDALLKKPSKDVDMLVAKIPYERIVELLQPFAARLNVVGKSFGVIKFTPHGSDMEIDIALPRVDKPAEQKNHNSIIVEADPFMPIEKDLERRDFTINSIALDSEGNTIDPFNGIEDIHNRILRATSKNSFADDPLRMLRAIAQSSRFDFQIESETWGLICAHAQDITPISPERIAIEFEKIVTKSPPIVGANLLIESGIFKHIFGVEFTGNINMFVNVKSLGDFGFALLQCTGAAVKFARVSEEETVVKHIKGLEIGMTADINSNQATHRWMLHNINKISPSAFASDLLPDILKLERSRLNGVPITFKEMSVNGDMLIEMGMRQGKGIGVALERSLDAIYGNAIKNSPKEILDFLNLK